MNGEIEITIKRIVNIEYMIKYMTDFIRYNSECSKKEVDMFLESAVGVIEKEDGTQTNLMEAKTKCFGCFDGNDIECCMCDDMKQCEEETNRKPDCFGNYEEEDGWEDSCDECMYAKECKKSFINKKKQREGITINE